MTEKEQNERYELLKRAAAERQRVNRYEWRKPWIEAVAKALREQPDNLARQREFLREDVAPCYPDFHLTAFSMTAHGTYDPPDSRSQARQGLDGVLYVMDYTILAEVLNDPERRVAFLNNIQALLGPFRAMRDGQELDLSHAFGFRAAGRGKRAQASLDGTMRDWGTACFDVHLLWAAGVKITPAIARVAEVHGKTIDAMRKAYRQWRKHPVRAEVLRQGDPAAKAMLVRATYARLIKSAFPALPQTIRPHRR